MNDPVEHPFSIPLGDLTAEELDRRYADLLQRWQIARRMQMNQGILYQLNLLLNSIELEKEKRAMQDEKPNGVVLDTDPIAIFKPKG